MTNGREPDSARWLQRFDVYDRLLHATLMTSFLGLAATGLPLRFSDAAWARGMARLLGGFPVNGLLHRTFAVLLIACFTLHVARVLHRLFVLRQIWMLWGPRSMVPQPRDVLEFVAHIRWFVGAGPRPRFDHFTYWEKFDYWAVFWGMAIIGSSGLVMWFPERFARFLPGWVFNVALLVHGEEALLAVGFIFTIHFFNTHLRPEKFPVDRVIFTGRVTEEEMKQERPLEFERLRDAGALDAVSVDPPPEWLTRLASVVAAIAVAIGLTLVVLIVYAVLL